MLREEEGDVLLNDLLNYEESHPCIRNISMQILETLDSNII